MRWPFSRPAAVEEPRPWPPVQAHPIDEEVDAGDETFVCSTCGRTDLPETGDWDPPICLECDAAINFDAEAQEAGWDG
jgi:hypothetical protein